MTKWSFMILILLIVTIPIFSQNKWLIGGELGISAPSNMGEKQFNLGFRDVAISGPRMALTTKWFYAKTLSLGAEMSFTTFPQNKSFWNVGRYGHVESSYHMASLTMQGDYFFSHRSFKPFAGISFGAYMLMNRMQFNSSYLGTSADASVGYKTFSLKPGYAPEIGFMAATSKKSFLCVNWRFHIIPNVKPSYIYIKDELGNTEMVTQNPQSHENHWSLAIGMLFNMN